MLLGNTVYTAKALLWYKALLNNSFIAVGLYLGTVGA